MSPMSPTPTPDFYPRPPRGGRPGAAALKAEEDRVFLPTPSARRATATFFGDYRDI